MRGGNKVIELNGNWMSGYAFDIHTLYSIYEGCDEYGHPNYETKRTLMGEAVYKLKYRNDKGQVFNIINLLQSNHDFLSFIQDVNVIIPVPPTKKRDFQPVVEIAKQMAIKFQISFLENVLFSMNTQQMKNVPTEEKYETISDKIVIDFSKLNKSLHYLIFDDLYDSGTTLKVYVDKFVKKGYDKISVFTLTKTRRPD